MAASPAETLPAKNLSSRKNYNTDGIIVKIVMHDEEVLGMRIIKKEPTYEGTHIRILKEYYKTDTGREGFWETVERTNIHHK